MGTKRYHFDAATLAEGHERSVWQRQPIGIESGDDGVYRCLHCGCNWTAEIVWAWWPVSLRMARKWSFGRHGVQVGSDGIERRVCAQVWSIGPLRVVLGADRLGGGK